MNVMSGMLHPTVKRPDARWRLSVDEVVRAASDADVIRCTDGCLDEAVRAASDVDVIRCTDGYLDEVVRAASDADAIRCTGG